jgi:hypothetical protein
MPPALRRLPGLTLPDLGVRGNSHMLMHDRNSLQIGDVILKWPDENT